MANCHAKIVALCVKTIFIIYYKREEHADGSLGLYGFSIFISARENSCKDGFTFLNARAAFRMRGMNIFVGRLMDVHLPLKLQVV